MCVHHAWQHATMHASALAQVMLLCNPHFLYRCVLEQAVPNHTNIQYVMCNGVNGLSTADNKSLLGMGFKVYILFMENVKAVMSIVTP